MDFRLAKLSDVGRIIEIIADAQSFLKENGVDQWQNGYPTSAVFEDDIKNGSCYVAFEDEKIVGVISLFFEKDACYDLIEDGKWLTGDARYAVFHRAAVDGTYRGKGIASQMLSFTESLARERGINSMRGDTHRNNKAMRRLLERRGYVHCGSVHIKCEPDCDSHRVAYEKILNN